MLLFNVVSHFTAKKPEGKVPAAEIVKKREVCLFFARAAYHTGEGMAMLGQLELDGGRGGRAERGSLYGMPVLRVRTDPEGWLGERRLRRAGKALRRGGVLRTLTPEDFSHWPLLARCGLLPVEPVPFLRAQSPALALELLDRQGVAPERATVALRGQRADREMARAAAELCPKVGRLVISASRGGEELAHWLRWEFGIPVLPAGEWAQVEVCFRPEERRRAAQTLGLYGSAPELAGLRISAPALAEEDRGNLPLLAALWEGGRLPKEGLKIT